MAGRLVVDTLADFAPPLCRDTPSNLNTDDAHRRFLLPATAEQAHATIRQRDGRHLFCDGDDGAGKLALTPPPAYR